MKFFIGNDKFNNSMGVGIAIGLTVGVGIGAAISKLATSPNQLFEMATERFIRKHQAQAPFDAHLQDAHLQDAHLRHPGEQGGSPVSVKGVINQGDIFWIQPKNPGEAQLGFYSHPHVVIQDNLLNHSRIHSVVVCALTTNLKQAHVPGNVLLEIGEANLPRHSVVVVSKVTAVNKSQLGAYIGTLTEQRVKQILAGMRLLQASFFAR